MSYQCAVHKTSHGKLSREPGFRWVLVTHDLINIARNNYNIHPNQYICKDIYNDIYRLKSVFKLYLIFIKFL
jgi:hypothetical protein